ncbi:MAG: hypothetical protein Q9162_003004 [Coniocarpon cinnabarinum]
MGSNPPPPVRIPKLKVRNRVDDTTSVPPQLQQQDANPAFLASASTLDSPNAPSTPSNGIYSPTPHRPSQASSIFTLHDSNPPKKKKNGIMNFLTAKEPSTDAFLKYAEQQRRAAALKGPGSASMQNLSRQKLPEYVPKVNSKWDGMPKIAHEPGNDTWKHSTDQDSFLGRISIKTVAVSNQGSSSSGSWSGHSHGPSGTPGSSSSRGSRGSSGRGSSGRTSRQRMEAAQADAFSLSRSPSNSQVANSEDGVDQGPGLTDRFKLDGHDTAPNSARPSVTAEFDDALLSLTQMPSARRTSSNETLRAVAASSAIQQDQALEENNEPPDPSPEVLRPHEPPPLVTDHPPVPKQSLEIDSEKLPTPSKEFTYDTPDDVFSESPHIKVAHSLFDDTSPSTPVARQGSQWPLPAPFADSSPLPEPDLAAPPPPPIPCRSPFRSTTPVATPQSPSLPPTSPERVTSPRSFSRPFEPPQASSSTSSPPQSPLRTGSASPRSFSRPFAASTAPTPAQNQFATPPQSPSLRPPEPASVDSIPSNAIAGPAIRPLHMRSHGFQSPGLLRPPANGGKQLTPILESDAASQLSVPVSMHLADDASERASILSSVQDDEVEWVRGEGGEWEERMKTERLKRESDTLGVHEEAVVQVNGTAVHTTFETADVGTIDETPSLGPFRTPLSAASHNKIERTDSGPVTSDQDATLPINPRAPLPPAPYPSFDPNADANSISDTASIRSQLSLSWKLSPKERLGLGGFIRHDRSGVPWRVPGVEDLEAVPVEDGEMKKRKGWWGFSR